MLTGIDHVVILAADLDDAVSQYGQLGFTVTPGGRHPRFTHNALVTFQDGSYLELIAFYDVPQPGSGDTHRWARHLDTGRGLVDFAVGTSDVRAMQLESAQRGLAMSGPVDGARRRPDGAELAWRSIMPEGENLGAVPFVIEDVTERGLRVPVENAVHENEVTGIASLVVATSDLDGALRRYAALTGQGGETIGEVSRDDARGVAIAIGSHRLEIVTPTTDGPMRDMLQRRGDSVYELRLRAPQAKDINPSDAADARIRLVTA